MRNCKGCPYYYAEPDWCMFGELGVPNNLPKKCDKKRIKLSIVIERTISRLLLRFTRFSPRTRNMVIKIIGYSRYQELFRY